MDLHIQEIRFLAHTRHARLQQQQPRYNGLRSSRDRSTGQGLLISYAQLLKKHNIYTKYFKEMPGIEDKALTDILKFMDQYAMAYVMMYEIVEKDKSAEARLAKAPTMRALRAYVTGLHRMTT